MLSPTWLRYWARQLDHVYFFPAWLLPVFLCQYWFPMLSKLFALILAQGSVLVTEAFCVSWLGTTPGKWSLGIRLKHLSGQRIGFRAAWSRTWRVWAQGLGLGIPVIGLLSQWRSRRHLLEKGVTRWDERVQLQVRHSSVGWGRFLLACFFPILLLLTVVLISRYQTTSGL